MTYDLFSEPGEGSNVPYSIQAPGADISLWSSLFPEDDANRLFRILRQEILWEQEKVSLYGKVHDLPRLTAWYGEPGKTYSYSGIKAHSSPWTPALIEIKKRIENVSDTRFNSVLLNLYRDGSDSVSWHADDEPELGTAPIIGSVSFGESRVFQMKHRVEKKGKLKINLENGSYLLMKGATQHNWIHQIAKSGKSMGERINLTYRVVT